MHAYRVRWPCLGDRPRALLSHAIAQGAIELTKQAYRDRYTIQVAPGVYNEKIIVVANRPPVTLIGMSPKVRSRQG